MNFMQQGLICPVAETEKVPRTSPIVLVSKRNKHKSDVTRITREHSLTSFRFCCDFRYLNLQTTDYRYAAPDSRDLTESFTTRTPNVITALDLSS